MDRIARRDFILNLAFLFAAPLGAIAQQPPALQAIFFRV